MKYLFEQKAPAGLPDRPAWPDVPPDIVLCLEKTIGQKIIGADIASGGYGPSAAFIAKTAAGKFFFIKGTHPGQDAHGFKALEQEIAAYQASPEIAEVSPRYLGRVDQGDDDDWHLAVFDFVLGAHTPLPWNESKMVAVFDVLKKIHGAQPSLAPVSQDSFMKDFISGKGGWHRIFNEERPRKNFLSLFKDQEMALDWLSSSLPALIAATEDAQNLGGVTGIIHGDLRSDNILFDQNGRVFLIDWTNACIGPVILDLAFFISGLAAESGIPAQKLLEIYQDRTGFSFTCRDIGCALAAVSGYYAVSAGKAVPPRLPQLRWVQKQHLWGSLCWLTDSLVLPAPPEFDA